MPTPQLALPQQFGRFLLTGALVFVLAFWISSWFLVSTRQAHTDVAVVRILLSVLVRHPSALWFHDLQTGYIPYFLRQSSLLACYSIAISLAWLAAFLYDSKILRKENTL
jgi:hypothetical protein